MPIDFCHPPWSGLSTEPVSSSPCGNVASIPVIIDWRLIIFSSSLSCIAFSHLASFGSCFVFLPPWFAPFDCREAFGNACYILSLWSDIILLSLCQVLYQGLLWACKCKKNVLTFHCEFIPLFSLSCQAFVGSFGLSYQLVVDICSDQA